MKITIIGCGHGGQALAAHLSMLEHQVTLYADEQHPGSMDGIIDNTIHLEGKVNGLATLRHLTKDIEFAVKDAEVIYLTLPTYAHLPQFRKMIPYLRKGQIVANLTGSFSSIYFYNELLKQGIEKKIYLADLELLPYACRSIQPGKVTIIEVKKTIGIAAMPSIHTAVVVDKISSHFPSSLSPKSSVLEVGFNNLNGVHHPILMLTNVGRIGQGEQEYYFYKEGISPDISHIVEKLDSDRQKIGENYGINLPSFLDLIESLYSTKYPSYYDFAIHSPVHNQQKMCPPSIYHRYFSEDVPYAIVPWYNLGLQTGYDSTVMRAIIELSSILNSTDYYTNGRLIARDFFANMEKKKIFDFMLLGSSI
ncbi:MAG: NAD/NADP octopine/nopaline dehydrogenase family protein [Enterobacteriaceae bacterium]